MVEQGPIQEAVECELIQGLYEPKQFTNALFERVHDWDQHDDPEHTATALTLTLIEKRYDRDSMVYTDGSYKKETNLTGAGLYGLKMAERSALSCVPVNQAQSTPSTELNC